MPTVIREIEGTSDLSTSVVLSQFPMPIHTGNRHLGKWPGSCPGSDGQVRPVAYALQKHEANYGIT